VLRPPRKNDLDVTKCCATWKELSPLRIRRDTLREQGSFDDRLNAQKNLRKHNVSRGFYQNLNDFLPFSSFFMTVPWLSLCMMFDLLDSSTYLTFRLRISPFWLVIFISLLVQ
jgi:hypothetical protein